jgi:hypothetical protein
MHRCAAFMVALLLAACAGVPRTDPPSESPPSALPSPSASAAIDPEAALSTVICGGPSFPIEVLSQRGEAQDGDDPAAAALRALLTTPEASVILPATGWIQAVRTETTSFYIAQAPAGAEPPFVQAELELRDGTWRMVGFGQCWPMVDVGPDLGLAEFSVDPSVTLTPEMTEVPVLVTERACTGSASSEGRIVEPAVVESDTSVVVVFAVVPLEGDAFTCPGNPSTAYLLELPSPLGGRALLDGSSVPPRDATACPASAACP